MSNCDFSPVRTIRNNISLSLGNRINAVFKSNTSFTQLALSAQFKIMWLLSFSTHWFLSSAHILTDNQILCLSIDVVYVMEINTKQLKNSIRKVFGLNDNLCGTSSFHLEGRLSEGRWFIAMKQKTIFYFALWGGCGRGIISPSITRHNHMVLRWGRALIPHIKIHSQRSLWVLDSSKSLSFLTYFLEKFHLPYLTEYMSAPILNLINSPSIISYSLPLLLLLIITVTSGKES